MGMKLGIHRFPAARGTGGLAAGIPRGAAWGGPSTRIYVMVSLLTSAVAWGQATRLLVPGQPAVSEIPAPRATPPPIVYEQRSYARTVRPLVTPEKASSVVSRFQLAYAQWGRPRLLISINREILDGTIAAGSTNAVASLQDQPLTPEGLADFQTSREVERLFGRPLRLASVQLVDFRAGADWLAANGGLSAADRRHRLASLADIAIEVLISARPSAPPRWPGDATVSVPDIQVTAIRLSDSQVVGQASASDFLSGNARAAESTRVHGTPAIVEATAFALMEDMAKSAQ